MIIIFTDIGVCDLKSSETMDLSCLPYNTLFLKDSGEGEIVCDAEMDTGLCYVPNVLDPLVIQ